MGRSDNTELMSLSEILPIWMKYKMHILWFFVFLAIFMLAVDWWNWGHSEIMLFGLPYWILRVIVLTLVLSPVFWVFSHHLWGDR
jgi:hypothetical protein